MKRVILTTACMFLIFVSLAGCSWTPDNNQDSVPYVGTNGNWWYNGSDMGIKAILEQDASQRESAVAVQSVIKTESVANIDIYTITLTNGATYAFTVTNKNETPILTEPDPTEPEKQIYGTSGLTYYLIEDGTYEVSGGNAKGTAEVFIPETYNGKLVTRIADNAFSYDTALKKVTMPDSILEIGRSAFDNCSSLVDVSISKNVKIIGSKAFYECKALIHASFPENIQTIGSEAFYNCFSLDPFENQFNHLKSLGSLAFYNCSGLKGLVIPEGTTEIEEKAFYKCGNLKSVKIPNGVTSIGSSAFYDCTDLTSLTIPDGVTNISDYTFYGCTRLTHITIGSDTKIIGMRAFGGCKCLANITIPNKVTRIGQEAFAGCTSLTEIIIPDTVSHIGYYCFSGTKSLTAIVCSPKMKDLLDSNRSDFIMTEDGLVDGYSISENVEILTYEEYAARK